jgi:hypothetical protein
VTGAIHAGTSASSDVSNRTILKQQQALSKRKKQQPGRRHQSVAMIVKHNPYCQYKKCPGLNIQKQTTRAYITNYRCEECSIEKGTDVWLCNTVKRGLDGKQKKIECHIKYYAEKEIEFIVGAMRWYDIHDNSSFCTKTPVFSACKFSAVYGISS